MHILYRYCVGSLLPMLKLSRSWFVPRYYKGFYADMVHYSGTRSQPTAEQIFTHSLVPVASHLSQNSLFHTVIVQATYQLAPSMTCGRLRRGSMTFKFDMHPTGRIWEWMLSSARPHQPHRTRRSVGGTLATQECGMC